MPIPFTCPHCGVTTDVADQYAGQSGPCARCGQSITIPLSAGGPMNAPPARRMQGATIAIIILVAVLGVVVVCGGILAALLLPAVQAAREAARRAACMNNLKQIGLAMHNYHDANKHFPPAYVADKDGRPMHSWRVLLLPFLEEQNLYEQYRFDEPWDGPNNRLMWDQMPAVFRCPSDPQADPSKTSYAAITGAGTVFDGSKSASIKTITNGISKTVMVVEAPGSAMNWLEPKDLEVAELSSQINVAPGAGMSTFHPRGVNALYCDGSVRFLQSPISVEELKTMTQATGRD